MTQNLPVVIRELDPGDRGLILTSWVSTVLEICPRILPRELFWLERRYFRARYWELVSEVLEHRPDLFLLASNPDHSRQVFGWTCMDRNTIHMLWVKPKLRGYGIGSMLSAGNRSVSHWTTHCDTIGQRRRLYYKPRAWEDLINVINRTKTGGIPADDHGLEACSEQCQFGNAQ